MRKNIIVGLLCLVTFLAAYVGGTITTIAQTISHTTVTDTKNISPSGDEGGSQKPFVRLCGDPGGPRKPYNKTGP